MKTSGADGKCTLRMCVFLWSQPTKYQKPQTRKKIYALEIDFIDLSDAEIFAEFNSEISFEVRANGAEISPENSMHGLLQGKRKRLSPENCFYGMANLN